MTDKDPGKTALNMQPAGSLVRPGPIGRAVRLLLGLWALVYVAQLWQFRHAFFQGDFADVLDFLIGVPVGLYLVSYVINIGWGVNGKKWPLWISLALFALAGALGWLIDGSLASPVLGGVVFLWLLYVFEHLGLSFALAAILGTPGCEMRALPDLFARLRDHKAQEHCCPVGPLHALDAWEARRRQR